MSEAADILQRAREREMARAQRPPIDYQRMSKLWPVQKAALTRAKKRGPEQVLLVCAKAVREWDEIGAWPDDWSLFQRALDDVFPLFQAPRLEDLR